MSFNPASAEGVLDCLFPFLIFYIPFMLFTSASRVEERFGVP